MAYSRPREGSQRCCSRWKPFFSRSSSKFPVEASVPPLGGDRSSLRPDLMEGVMNSKLRHPSMNYRFAASAVITIAMLFLTCSAPTPRPTGDAAVYQNAQDMFKKGRFDRTLEFTLGLAQQKPPK